MRFKSFLFSRDEAGKAGHDMLRMGKMVNERQLQIGLAFTEQQCDGLDKSKVAQTLVNRLLDSVDCKRFPIRCLVLLATADWCRRRPSISKDIREELRKKAGYSVPLVGGSMARLYCSAKPKVFMEHGVVLIGLCSHHFRVTVDCLDAPHSNSEGRRADQVRQLAQRLEASAGIKLGPSAEKYLLGFFPGAFLDKQRKRVYLDGELYQEVLEAFGRKYPLSGASAADKMIPTIGYQFANDKCLTSSLALALIETDLLFGGTIAHGFEPCQNIQVSVDALEQGAATGYVVEQFNGKPAADILGEIASKVQYDKVLFGRPNGPDFDVLQVIQGPTKGKGNIRLNRKVKRGERLYVLDSTPYQMTTSSTGSLKIALDREGISVDNLSLFLAFACTSRFNCYIEKGFPWEQVIERFHKEYSGVRVVAGLCAGEFGIDSWRHSRMNNMSASINYIADKFSPNAEIRQLQRLLLTYERQLVICDAPRDVMSVAMEGALAAGGSGGQICIVDSKLRRIVNMGLGCTAQISPDVQDWEVVGQITDRKEPAFVKHLPLELRDYAFPAASDNLIIPTIDPASTKEEDEEDILTLVSSCFHAVYVKDCRDPIFRCDQDAVRRGKIFRQVVIPLVGSQGRPIATMQVGFMNDQELDGESFALWVSYAQKVASALERTQEAEERKIMQSISDLSEEIIHKPVSRALSSFYWCDAYLKKVLWLLQADGAHMRYFRKTADGEKYDLIGAEGHMAEVLKLTRPTRQAQEGAYDRRLLEIGGLLTNTRDATAQVNKSVKALGHTEYADELDRGISMVESAALLPLATQSEVFGAFVLESEKRYFFTERWERIARAAARHASAILRAKQVYRDKAELAFEQDEMLDTLKSSVSQDDAEKQLRDLVKRLCEVVRADVGSLYIWHGAPKKLVLRTGYNWYINKEGKASYGQNDGWTGKVPWAVKDVSIITQGPKTGLCTKRYYEFMVPPPYRVNENESDARVGIRLVTDHPVGALTFTYYAGHSDRLLAEDSRIAEFLRSLVNTITLYVEAARQSILRRQTKRFDKTKNNIFRDLMEASESGVWKPVLQSIHTGFEVDGVVLFLLKEDGRLEYVDSVSEDGSWHPCTKSAVAQTGFLHHTVHGNIVVVHNQHDDRLTSWPYREVTKNLCAVPVICTEGDVRGVLVFVNRRYTGDHPFEFFDGPEIVEATNVARMLGAAVDHYEHEQKDAREKEMRLDIAKRIGAASVGSAVVMHRLLRPFGRIQANIDWLRVHSDCRPQDFQLRLRNIEKYCSDAVRHIYEAARPDTSSLVRVKISTVVQEAIRAAEANRLPHTQLSVNNEVHDQILANAYSIVSAIANLIINAVEAMPEGGTLTINTKKSVVGREVVVSIHNTGPHYTREQLEGFLYLQKGKAGHLGLGLIIAQQSIEAASGRLNLTSPNDIGGVLVRVTLLTVSE